jgi:hypothetical protein
MTTATQFKGFEARTDKGTPVFVLNEGILTDGTPAYKVRMGAMSAYYATSHGAAREPSYNGATGWIAKSRIIRKRVR